MNIITKQGEIKGVEKDGYNVYLGIPYAKPPVGELRFCPPQELDVRTGVYYANKFCNMAVQAEPEKGSFYEKEFHQQSIYNTEKSEDCLYLNIWTPAKTGKEKLPVAFWIHGGALLSGCGHEMEFDGEEYCKRNVILVTINYRLGVFGFLAHPWLNEESERRISGNYGILDQIAALRWVVENIENFGGNPKNITVFGQSAGSMSAQTLISSELTKNWISKAIFQSAGGYNSPLNYDFHLEEALKIGEEFVSKCGVSSLTELRNIPSEIIMQKGFETMEAALKQDHFCYIPNIDGYVLKGGYDQLADEGRIKDIPYMVGSTREDIFVSPEILEKGEKGELYEACIKWSLKQEKLGRKPAYVYYFTHRLLGDSSGAFHSSELWYMFGTLKRSWRPKIASDYELSTKMLDYWTNFMKYGNPEGQKTGGWKPCTKENLYVKNFE